MPDLDLYGKTEVWVVGVVLDGARLPDIAAAAATALSLEPDDVFVTDVRDRHLVLDVLAPRVDLASVAGREQELLTSIGGVAGVAIDPDATVHSWGVLGVLGAPRDQVETMLEAADDLATRVQAYIARRVAVVTTGPELDDGRVHDTNLETIREVLEKAGFIVEPGGVVGDDEHAIAGRVGRLVADGYGVIITTGGVGAEDKDRTIEALELLDPSLSTAVLATYEVGHGRHVKPHVRVAVATVDGALVFALPGPTREVRAGVAAVVAALRDEEPPAAAVEAVASAIRALWPGSAGPR